jgi:Cft2 family RNA processing exonuclease
LPCLLQVVLSHADIAHTGALPYAVAQLGLRKNHIYCTLPVQHLGHLALYELLASRHDTSDFDDFSYDDIDAAFEAIQGVRFGQQVNISSGMPTATF